MLGISGCRLPRSIGCEVGEGKTKDGLTKAPLPTRNGFIVPTDTRGGIKGLIGPGSSKYLTETSLAMFLVIGPPERTRPRGECNDQFSFHVVRVHIVSEKARSIATAGKVAILYGYGLGVTRCTHNQVTNRP